MVTEQVRMWRPAGEDRVLLMAGRTTSYAMEPRGEYVVGVVASRPMRSRRGREHRLVGPGQLVVWDPSSAHSGRAVDDQPWSSRLMVIEVDALAALAGGQGSRLLDGIVFPEPVVSDPELVSGFLRLHAALEAPMARLEREERLAGWLRALVERSSASRLPRPPLSPRDDRALRRACDYLADRPERNVGLDELAAVADIDKFRLVHLFRHRIGLPPHALQLAHRVRAARRLLEAGQTIADTAAATGFADQSHLHRHFQRTLGLTPGEYQRRYRAPRHLVEGRSRAEHPSPEEEVQTCEIWSSPRTSPWTASSTPPGAGSAWSTTPGSTSPTSRRRCASSPSRPTPSCSGG